MKTEKKLKRNTYIYILKRVEDNKRKQHNNFCFVLIFIRKCILLRYIAIKSIYSYFLMITSIKGKIPAKLYFIPSSFVSHQTFLTVPF